MKYRKTLIAAAAAVLIPVAGTALANESKDHGMPGSSFDSLDTNRDGRISSAEAAVDSKIVFATADANADGYLDKAEFKKAHKAAKEGAATQSSEQPAADPSAPEASMPEQDQSAPAPADTETPRQ